jgi:DNA-binding GntR family transcriptional regulator
MALLAACQSTWQLHFAALLFDQAERYRLARARRKPANAVARQVEKEHRALFDAVLARDKRAAVKALDAHYRTTAREAVVALARQSP